jgi:hypothetical protein
MLSPEEALLMQAAYDERDRQQQMNAAGLLGAAGGAAMGVAGGQVPHSISRLLQGAPQGMNKVKPGFRAAGGVVGAILGGALGAGTAAVMKSDSPSARLLGKMQSGQELDVIEKEAVAQELAKLYSNPQVLM